MTSQIRIPDIANYTFDVINNVLILTPRCRDIDNNDLLKNELMDSINKSNHKYLRHGQRVVHSLSNKNLWEGIYDGLNDLIVCNGKEYKCGRKIKGSCLNNFAISHQREDLNRSTNTSDAHKACKKFLNGKWVPVKSSLRIDVNY